MKNRLYIVVNQYVVFLSKLIYWTRSWFLESEVNGKNNTYKNNNIDNVLGAGGLAWLGYRLDMAGITCSNHVRPTINLIIMISILQIFSRICWKLSIILKLDLGKLLWSLLKLVTLLRYSVTSYNQVILFLLIWVIQTFEDFKFFSLYLI